MTRHTTTFWVVLVLSLRLVPAQAQIPTQGLRQQYCSNQNTGSDSRPDVSTYQSNGYCHDSCSRGQYAFAIVQGQNCWCSNYIPAQQQDVSSCNSDCPGYPTDKCGNSGSGLFGYIALSNRPSGTAGAASPSSTPSQNPPSSSSPPPPSSTDAPQSSQQTSSPSPSTATDSPTPSPVTSVYVVTVSGAAITQTVTSIPTVAAEASQQVQGSGRTSSGTIAGAVVGGVAGLAAIGGFLIWLLIRMRRNSDGEDPDAERSGTSPRRNTSTMSKTGLLRSAEKEYPPVAIPATNRSSTLANDQDTSSPTSERRSSRPLFYDQRLNPSALMDLDNGSHTSIITMEDNRDYTRTLNIRNPDPSS